MAKYGYLYGWKALCNLAPGRPEAARSCREFHVVYPEIRGAVSPESGWLPNSMKGAISHVDPCH